jgi:hypothetical protein
MIQEQISKTPEATDTRMITLELAAHDEEQL